MKTYLALDVGGSSIKYALIQEDSTILEKSSGYNGSFCRNNRYHL